MDDRRDLRFERIDDVMPDVERLLDGSQTCGVWTLGQILSHLATAIRLTLRPEPPDRARDSDPARLRMEAVRRRRFFQSGRFPEGVEVPHPALRPPSDSEAGVEAHSLRLAIEQLTRAEGPFPAHPLLGTLSRQEWIDFHRIHCAHHLSFVEVSRTPS